jgi:D-alanine-D-alanine ligase
VKSLIEEASTGISQASVVRDEDQLRERVKFVHEHVGGDAIAEEYIEGRELYVGVLGNVRLETFPPWEMTFHGLPEGAPHIATSRVKFDHRYRKKHGITTGRAKGLPDGMEARLARLARRIYRALELSGYARIDLRLRADGEVFVLEANPNPDLAIDEDLAYSAEAGGLQYNRLIQRILNLGLRYYRTWHT